MKKVEMINIVGVHVILETQNLQLLENIFSECNSILLTS